MTTFDNKMLDSDIELMERKNFEEAAFLQYYISNIGKVNDPIANTLQIHFAPVCKIKDKVDFVAKKEDNSYLDDTLNIAWWAWKKRAEKEWN